MTTALTCYAITTNSTTLSTARELISASGGAQGTGVSTKVGNNTTGWFEEYSQGNGTATIVGSQGSADGHGFLFDVTTLENQTIVSGSWVFTFNFAMLSASSTMTGTMNYRAYKRSSGGTYTSICSGASSSQSISGTTVVSVAVTVNSVSAVSFSTGDKLYSDIWIDETTGDFFNGSLNYFPSNSTSAGWSGASIQTPGYNPTGGVIQHIICCDGYGGVFV